MLSQVQNTYSAFFFISLKEWKERKKPEEQYEAIKASSDEKDGRAFPAPSASPFPPPAIMGIGTSGGATFMLQDKAGKDVAFLAENTQKFIEAARKTA